jgi:exopolyphosphatase/guanosine-5'-triphosphate,3'-diphosphate pyrophosphatase
MAHRPAPVIGAAIDVGATSVHLLVAELHGHRLRVVLDVSELLRLGEVVDVGGALGPAARIRLIACLLRYRDAARAAGAGEPLVVGTEPLRRASDATDAAGEVASATGLTLHVLDHVTEGLLTLLGVTSGRPVRRELLVVDVGGGSSEFVSVGPDEAAAAHGVRVGAARLTAAIVAHDPPTPDELHALLEEARRLITEAPDVVPERLVVVGGTASNLLRVVPGGSVDRSLTRRRIAAAMVLLAHEPAGVVAQTYGVNPHRARILPAGAAIMGAIIERYGVPRLRVSEAGIREGAILAGAHAGSDWQRRLPQLLAGWGPGSGGPADG